MRKEYDEQTLKRLQKTELEIFKDFAKVCEENNISYFAVGGTAIGAIRHGGFIPWDDDIDVMLIRKDYDKLIEIFDRDYSDKYIIMRADRFKNYPLMTTRIILKNTKFVEYSLKNCNEPLGIFLDVYPVDNISKNEAKHSLNQKKAYIYSKLLILKHVPFPYLAFGGFKAKLVHCVTAAVWFLLNLFCISHNFLYKKALSASTASNNEDCDAFEWYFHTTMGRCVYYKNLIYPIRETKFEDTKICLMGKAEEELGVEFGDFMKLPPVEKRKNHFPYKLKFPDSDEVITGV